MPGGIEYEACFSNHAAAFVIALPRRRQRRVLDLAGQIARHPFQIGDYRLPDATGREVENLLLEGYLFSYWIDHAAREVRIAEIVKV